MKNKILAVSMLALLIIALLSLVVSNAQDQPKYTVYLGNILVDHTPGDQPAPDPCPPGSKHFITECHSEVNLRLNDGYQLYRGDVITITWNERIVGTPIKGTPDVYIMTYLVYGDTCAIGGGSFANVELIQDVVPGVVIHEDYMLVPLDDETKYICLFGYQNDFDLRSYTPQPHNSRMNGQGFEIF